MQIVDLTNNIVELHAQRADITQLRVDAIVNAANPTLLGGGGVDGAIHRAAGPELLAACRKFGGCERGEAVITPGFDLPAKYVVHTPGPIWRGGNEHEVAVLAQSYANSLRLADAAHCQSVAFPAISAGVYHFPLQLAETVAVAAVTAYVTTHATGIRKVLFVDVVPATVTMFASVL